MVAHRTILSFAIVLASAAALLPGCSDDSINGIKTDGSQFNLADYRWNGTSERTYQTLTLPDSGEYLHTLSFSEIEDTIFIDDNWIGLSGQGAGAVSAMYVTSGGASTLWSAAEGGPLSLPESMFIAGNEPDSIRTLTCLLANGSADILAGTTDGGVMYYDGESGKWHRTGLDAGLPVIKLAKESVISNRIFAATRSSVWISSNGGYTWPMQIPNPIHSDIVDIAASQNYLFMTTKESIYRCNLSDVGSGLKLIGLAETGENITAIAAFSAKAGGSFFLFVATDWAEETLIFPDKDQTIHKVIYYSPDIIRSFTTNEPLPGEDMHCMGMTDSRSIFYSLNFSDLSYMATFESPVAAAWNANQSWLYCNSSGVYSMAPTFPFNPIQLTDKHTDFTSLAYSRNGFYIATNKTSAYRSANGTIWEEASEGIATKSSFEGLRLLEGTVTLNDTWPAGTVNIENGARFESRTLTARAIQHFPKLVYTGTDNIGNDYYDVLAIRYSVESGGALEAGMPYLIVYYAKGTGPVMFEQYDGSHTRVSVSWLVTRKPV